MTTPTQIKDTLKKLPDNPGVYQFYDKTGKVIYVGKAKNLKKRVSSYFQKEHDNRKLEVLVSKIEEIRYIVVGSEQEALLLENNLIKKYQLHYNVLLKDDKSFPWICIKDEPFPRIFLTRHYIQDGSIYYGPYTSAYMIRVLLNLIKDLFPLRTCGLDLSEKKISAGKYTACLEYHIGNCKAPCISKQSLDEYSENVSQIRNILKGNISTVLTYLKDLMSSYAAQYKFEDAQSIKEKIELIEKYRSKSIIVSTSIHDVDVFSYVEKETVSFVNYIKVLDGAIVQVHTVELRKKLDEPKEEMMMLAIADVRQKLQSHSKEILVPFELDLDLDGVEINVPRIGDKKKLLDLSERNAKHYAHEVFVSETKIREASKGSDILEQMKKDLRLNSIPVFMECFDNSNIQGTDPVASCVVFKNAKPFKSEYKHFNIKTVEGPDDFATMEEVIYRRYKRLLDEDKRMPDLVVIDGGKGQLSAAMKSLEKLGLNGQINIIGIAKRLEEIFIPGDPVSLYIDKNSPTLKVIQHIRNEAHRFGVEFHRLKRSQSMISTEFDNIKGVGEKTLQVLIKNFSSLENLRHQSFESIAELVGEKKAQLLVEYLKKPGSAED